MSQLIRKTIDQQTKVLEYVRIGTSECYLGVRTGYVDGDSYKTLVMYHWGSGGVTEMDSYDHPTSSQAKELIKLLSQFL